MQGEKPCLVLSNFFSLSNTTRNVEESNVCVSVCSPNFPVRCTQNLTGNFAVWSTVCKLTEQRKHGHVFNRTESGCTPSCFTQTLKEILLTVTSHCKKDVTDNIKADYCDQNQ